MKYIKSPLNYTGGKYKLLKDLLDSFPKEIDTFVDLFAGGFNVGVNIEANKIICNDHITYLIDLYKEL
ncbi:MAG: DNA adenine methylase, partial [Clostridium sp.]